MPRENIQEEANRHYASRFGEDMTAMLACIDGETETVEYEGEMIDESDAMERLQEQPLSFQKVITDHINETIQWEILLGTGGPADRVMVTTDYHGSVESAEYQFQDWFQPWTTAEDQDEALVQRYAELVGYYEVEENWHER
jgi:hypothetical protein